MGQGIAYDGGVSKLGNAMARLGAIALVLVAASGCKKKASSSKGSPSASVAAAAPLTPEQEKKLLPAGKEAYRGPTGTISGVVRVSGDEAPTLHELLAKIPSKSECDPAREVYARLFREGPGRTLGDVLVTATKYDAKGKVVLPKSRSVVVNASGCAFDTRTVAMTTQQVISVFNVGKGTVLPSVAGQPELAVMVAMPGGDPVNLVVPRPGRYGLVDRSNQFSSANVFSLNYATHDVTGVDGAFTIEGVPVGAAEVNAFLPITGVFETKKVTVRQGQTVTVDFTLAFDRASYEAQRDQGAPSPATPSPSGSSAASPSGSPPSPAPPSPTTSPSAKPAAPAASASPPSR